MLSITLFSTSTCAHCKPMKKTLEELAKAANGSILFNTIVVDKDPKGKQMASVWHVRAVPTTVLIMNGEEIGKIEGNHPKESLEKLIEGCLQSDLFQKPSGGSECPSPPVLCDSSGTDVPVARSDQDWDS